MTPCTIQLVLHYDGGGFAGWQRQPEQRTVQGVVEDGLAHLCGMPITVIAAGRTDAGVHARGQAAGVRVPPRWKAATLQRALNAILPPDIWIAAAFDMHEQFHARYSAITRRYCYYIGTDEEAASPFRRRYEWRCTRPLALDLLEHSARGIVGDHCFRAFAVRGTAPPGDDHRCTIRNAAWQTRQGGLFFLIEGNRFLHHMVRFLVGTMIEVAGGRRDRDAVGSLLRVGDTPDAAAPATQPAITSPPAPAHGLFLERVEYPAHLYLASA